MSNFDSLCRCFARDNTRTKPERYQWMLSPQTGSTTLWAIHAPCVLHGESFKTPVWNRHMGRLDAETASGELAVQLEALT